MTTIDWLLFFVLLVSVALSFSRRLAYEAWAVLSWLVVFYLALWFAPRAFRFLPLEYASASERYAVAFLFLFIVEALLVALAVLLVMRLIKPSPRRPSDRSLAWVFGLMRGVILLLSVTVVVQLTTLKSSPSWRESGGASALTSTLKGLRPVLPERFTKYLS